MSLPIQVARATAVVLTALPGLVLAQGACPASIPARLSDTVTGGIPAIIVAPGSSTNGTPFVVQDAAGRTVPGVEVEFTATPGSGITFLEGDFPFYHPAPNPLRVRVRTDPNCAAIRTPALMTTSTSTAGAIQARVVSAPLVSAQALPAPVSLAVNIVQPETVSLFSNVLPGQGPHFATPGAVSSPAPSAIAAWGAQGSGGTLGGAAVVFRTAPTASTFANGTASISVTTNALGVASAPITLREMPGGKLEVRAAVGDKEGRIATYYDASPIAISLDAARATLTYGQDVPFVAKVTGLPCLGQTIRGQFQLRGDQFVVPLDYFASDCQNEPGEIVARQDSLRHLVPGTHHLVVEMTGTMHAPIRSAPFTVVVAPDYETMSARGGSVLRLGAAGPGLAASTNACVLANARAGLPGDAGFPAQGPVGVDVPLGMLRFDLQGCKWESEIDFTIPAPPGPMTQRIFIGSSVPLPENSAVWAYGKTVLDATVKWREIPASFTAGGVVFDIGENLEPTIAIGTRPQAMANYQDLWWAGPQENGWGLSITQHDDRIFGALFVYDAEGAPRWAVMPGGQWDAARRVFTADIYVPRGSPFYAYNAAQFQAGVPAGNARLEFEGPDAMTMTFVLNGVPGTKRLTRQKFGPPTTQATPRIDGLYWGGERENGWGLAVHQQQRNLFAIWFTYDSFGDTTWYVAPSAVMGAYRNGIAARMYRTHGPDWLGGSYDPAKVSVIDVGTLHFSSGGVYDSVNFRAEMGTRTFGRQVFLQPF